MNLPFVRMQLFRWFRLSELESLSVITVIEYFAQLAKRLDEDSQQRKTLGAVGTETRLVLCAGTVASRVALFIS